MNDLQGKKSVGSSSSLGQFLTGASRQPTNKDLKQNKSIVTSVKELNGAHQSHSMLEVNSKLIKLKTSRCSN